MALSCGAMAHAQLTGSDADVWEHKLSTARELRENRDFDKSRQILEGLIASADNSKDRIRSRKACSALAAVYFFEGDLQKAEAINRQALAAALADPPLSNSERALVLADLAEVLLGKAEKETNPEKQKALQDEAITDIDMALDMVRKAFSRNNPSLSSRMSFLSELYAKGGQKAKSDEVRIEAGSIVNAFLSDMSIKIKRAWQPPKRTFSYSAEVGFEVLDHGRVDQEQMLTSSNDADADKACIAAVKAAQPFADITKESDEDKLFLSFRFDYNFSNENKSGHENEPHKEQNKEQAKEKENLLAREKANIQDARAKIKDLRAARAHDSMQLALQYARLSASLRNSGSFDESVRTLKSALNLKEYSRVDSPGTLVLLSELGATYLRAMEPELAEKTLTMVVENPNFKKLGDQKVKARALEDLGHALSTLGRFAEAQKYYLEKRQYSN